MARQFENFYSHGAINFSDFVNCVSSLYTGPDCLDDSTLRLLAEMLYRLSQNKQFLAAQVAGSSNYQPHVRAMLANDDLYVLYENKRPFFKVCAQIWHPTPKRGTQCCFIPQVRDYNFTALTTNYFGPGCGSKLYQYEYRKDLQQGDHCDLQFEQFYQFTPESVLFTEASRDVIAQALPKSLSITISLQLEQRPHACFVFDKSSGRVQQIIADSAFGYNERPEPLLIED
ncbi:transposase [Pseudoalteromonas sp. HM-SA03]|uniref:transposase n=1 Tax=Pseudoalteromonas sp. HM-SA03 TaxID=2029678 RepID=UPI000BAE1722|nr:transposase [Pseudoalteromonas sp. HM-SA03]PAY01824.1 transposase [Pseudoalteromonas sp. HM-SA03]